MLFHQLKGKAAMAFHADSDLMGRGMYLHSGLKRDLKDFT